MRRALVVILAAAGIAGCTHTATVPPVANPATPPAANPAPQVPAVQPVPAPSVQPSTPPQPVAERPAPAPKPVKRVIEKPVKVADTIATADGITIDRGRIIDAVMESHGLNMLLRVVQVEMAKQMAQKEGVVANEQDVRDERVLTLGALFKDANQTVLDEIANAEADGNLKRATELKEQLAKDNDALLPQLLVKQNMTVGEFNLLMEANANLRKLTKKQVAGKLTDQNIHEAFLNIYGENVRVRHIQLNNIAEVTEAQNRLAAGTPFQDVAKAMSRNPTTRELGGELLPFSRETQNLPDSFKQVAFLLTTPGQVSDPVEANGAYHLIQLVERIPPKAVRYEDVKDSVEAQLYERWTAERMKAARDLLARKATETLQINDPVLAKQFKDRIQQRETEVRERGQIKREIEREGDQVPVPGLNGQGNTPGNLRPPATRSGSDTPDQKPDIVPLN